MDLSTRYLGLRLKHPIIASASPISEKLDGIKKLEDSGASAVVMYSLFEEQIQRERAMLEDRFENGSESFAESLSFFPQNTKLDVGPDHYLNLIHEASKAVDIPIIASLNCVSREGWIDYAKALQQAGAKAIELNIYSIETDFSLSATEVEQRYITILKEVKEVVTIPIAMKLSPFFSSFGNMAFQLEKAGVDGLVLFNRFYQPDFDIDRLEISPTLNLSRSEEIRLPLLWIGLLFGKVKASLGATSGVHSSTEVIKYLLAGADTVMTTSALLRHGPIFIDKLLHGLKHWMESREISYVDEMRGVMSMAKVAHPAAFERANYIKVLDSYH